MAEQPNITQLPSFPTTWGEAEQTRLTTLEKQRAQMQQIYQAKFTPDAWSKINPLEKTIRKVASGSFFEPAISALTPWQWGWDFGLTPEMAANEMLAVEPEYKELVRKQIVTDQLPVIERSLEYLALAGTPVLDLTELKQRFQQLNTNFNDDELGWVAGYAQKLAKMTPDEIMTQAGAEAAVSGKTIEEWLAASPTKISPTQVLSSVAFTKDIGEIAKALQTAYPPTTTAPTSSEQVQKTVDDLKTWVASLGLPVVEGESTVDTLQRVNDFIAEHTGVPITLNSSDNSTPPVAALLYPDGSVRTVNNVTGQSELIGNWDKVTNAITPPKPQVPFIPAQKFPTIPTVSTKTTLQDTLFPGVSYKDMPTVELVPAEIAASVLGKSLQYLPSQVGVAVLQATQGEAGASVVNKDWADVYIAEANEDLNSFIQDITKRYPDSSALINMSQISQNLAYSITSMGAGAAVGIPMAFIPLPGARIAAWAAGSAASGAVAYRMTTYQITQTYLELKNKEMIGERGTGLTQEEEDKLKADFHSKAVKYGLWEAVPEAISNLLFAKILISPLTSVVGKSMATQIVGKIAGMYGEELLTETITQKGQTAVEVEAGLRDKNITWVEAFKEIAPQTFLLTTIMAGAGQTIISSKQGINRVTNSLKDEIGESHPLYEVIRQGIETESKEVFEQAKGEYESGLDISDWTDEDQSSFDNLERYLPEDVKEKFSTDVQDAIARGRTEKEARRLSYEGLVGDELGQAQVDIAKEKAIETPIPTVDEETGEVKLDVQPRIDDLTTRINTLNDDIENGRGIITGVEEKLSKAQVLGERAKVNEFTELLTGMKEQLASLEADKKVALDQMTNLREGKVETAPRAVKVSLTQSRLEKEVYEIHLEGVEESVGAVVILPQPDTLFVNRIAIHEEGVVTRTMLKQLDTLLADMAKEQGKKYVKIAAEPRLMDSLAKAGYKQETGTNVMTKEVSGIVPPEVPKEGKIIPTEGIPEVTQESISWDRTMTHDDKVQMAVIAGVAKTSATKPWSELTDVQQDKLRAVMTPVAPEVTEGVVPEVLPTPPITPPSLPPEERTVLPSSQVSLVKSPRNVPIEGELRFTAESLKAHPEIADRMRVLNRVQKRNMVEAEAKLKDLHTRLAAAIDNKEVRKAISKEVSSWAKESGLRTKDLYAKGWDDLTPYQQSALATTMLKDGSVPWLKRWEILDSRLTFLDWQTMTGQPWADVNRLNLIGKDYVDTLLSIWVRGIRQFPGIKEVMGDVKSLNRIEQEVLARDRTSGIKPPEGLTETEAAVAEYLITTNKQWAPVARLERFIEAYKDNNGKVDAMAEDYVRGGEKPSDALKQNIELAKTIYEAQGEDALYNHLLTQTWGTIEEGYLPRPGRSATLTQKKPPLSATRGGRQLETRQLEDYIPDGKGLVIQREMAYIQSLGIRSFMRDYIRKMGDMFTEGYDKWENPQKVKTYLEKYLTELQSIPQSGGALSTLAFKTYNAAAPVIFWNPLLVARNYMQLFATNPHPLELFRALKEFHTLPADVRLRSRVYFDTVISQTKLGASELLTVKRDNAFAKARGGVSGAVEKTSMYPNSDKYTRLASYNMFFNKAYRALAKYEKDGNLDRFIKKSGMDDLTIAQQDQALSLFARDEIEFNIPGLDTISGREAAVHFIAEETTNKYFAMYNRVSRSSAEWGLEGRLLGSILVFPKTYIQTFFQETQKMLSKDSTPTEKFNIVKRVATILLTGAVADSAMSLITGKKRNDYNPLNMFAWEMGGLSLGLVQDVQGALGDIINACTGTDDMKERALNTLAYELPRLADTFVGFYKITMDIVEAATDVPNIDRNFLRQVRALIDKDYTPEQQEAAKWDLVERLQHIFADSPGRDETQYEKIMTGLTEAEARLGTRDAQGKFYTLSQLDGDIESMTKPLPSQMVSEDYGFSPLVIFHRQCADDWAEYYAMPTYTKQDAAARLAYRQTHLDVEAMMLFWGKYKRPVEGLAMSQLEELRNTMKVLFSLYNIDYRYDHPYFPDWSLPE